MRSIPPQRKKNAALRKQNIGAYLSSCSRKPGFCLRMDPACKSSCAEFSAMRAMKGMIGIFNLLAMIALACMIKLFFAYIKRGGILLTQIAVGTLYMFSIPRGYADGFNQWVKQVVAFLTMRFGDASVLDYIKRAARYFVMTQQFYVWKRRWPRCPRNYFMTVRCNLLIYRL